VLRPRAHGRPDFRCNHWRIGTSRYVEVAAARASRKTREQRGAEGLLFGDRCASINGIIHADNEEPDTGFADCIRDLRLRVAAPVIAPSEITTSTLRSFRPEVACLKPR